MIQKNVNLSEKTKMGYRIGGTADYFIEVKNAEDIRFAINFAKEKNIPFFILGNGSNLLVSDKGYRGLVISCAGLDKITFNTQNSQISIIAESGVSLNAIISKTIGAGLGGLEELSGIPASVGGAILMNAGAYSQTISGNLSEIGYFDCDELTEKVVSQKEANFSYRSSIFKQKNWLILWAKFEFNKPGNIEKNTADLQARQNEILQKRKANQPLNAFSCGSVFKNPQNLNGKKVWSLIDEVGLRGYRVGGAVLSEKHSNFILNDMGATAEDIRKIIREARLRVKNNLGILIEPEVKFLGEFETEIDI